MLDYVWYIRAAASAVGGLVLAAMTLVAVAATVRELPADQGTAANAPPPGLLQRFCVPCHNDRLNTAGVSLQSVDPDRAGEQAAILERALHKLRSGEMPPPGRPRPDPDAASAFVTRLERSLDEAAAAHPNPGRSAIHRLNRAEYSNAIRDLLALDINAGRWLPADDSGYGFDNIADVLSTSPALLERYLTAARRISRLAVGELSAKPATETYESSKDLRPGDLPFGARGGLSVRHYFPLDAEYRIQIVMGQGQAGTRVLPAAAGPGAQPSLEVRARLKAGLHSVGVIIAGHATKPEMESPASLGPRMPGPLDMTAGGRAAGIPDDSTQVDLRIDGARFRQFEVAPRDPGFGSTEGVKSLAIAGPYNPTGRGDTPSRARIFVCRPARARDERPCARAILRRLARRAFRRPVAAADIEPLMAFYERGRRGADFDAGIEGALRALLVAPEFVLRLEGGPRAEGPRGDGARRDGPRGDARVARGPGAERVQRISDLQLASRLSFFIWSTIPDDELLGLAERGTLHEPAVLQQQVRRMLADPRSDALVDNFAGQWLQVRNLGLVRPDPGIFRFDAGLREAMAQETSLFVDSILHEDRSVLDFLAADYTFVNERLAEHYGMPGIHGRQFRRVAVTDPNRRGLLGQGSILTVTSYPNRTSIVQRGKWVLENLLSMPPPPPPPNVPNLKPQGRDGRPLSMRQQMEQHRTNAVCAACHARMDPLGFALENYDGVGKWRTQDAGAIIDPSGTLPDGTAFRGPAGLTNLLLTTYCDQFVRTVVEKLLTYALGRGLDYYDQPAVRSIAREAARDAYRISSLITAIARSVPFQMREEAQP